MYSHTQSGGAIRWAMVAGAMLSIGLAVMLPAEVPGAVRGVLGVTALLLLVVMAIFGSLTVTVGQGLLTWSFSFGFLRRSVPIADVAEALSTRTTFFDGWGIHVTRRGLLYNVSGFEAVWIRLKSGKQFLLGTDEPAELVAAIDAGRSGRRA